MGPALGAAAAAELLWAAVRLRHSPGPAWLARLVRLQLGAAWGGGGPGPAGPSSSPSSPSSPSSSGWGGYAGGGVPLASLPTERLVQAAWAMAVATAPGGAGAGGGAGAVGSTLPLGGLPTAAGGLGWAERGSEQGWHPGAGGAGDGPALGGVAGREASALRASLLPSWWAALVGASERRLPGMGLASLATLAWALARAGDRGAPGAPGRRPAQPPARWLRAHAAAAARRLSQASTAGPRPSGSSRPVADAEAANGDGMAGEPHAGGGGDSAHVAVMLAWAYARVAAGGEEGGSGRVGGPSGSAGGREVAPGADHDGRDGRGQGGRADSHATASTSAASAAGSAGRAGRAAAAAATAARRPAAQKAVAAEVAEALPPLLAYLHGAPGPGRARTAGGGGGEGGGGGGAGRLAALSASDLAALAEALYALGARPGEHWCAALLAACAARLGAAPAGPPGSTAVAAVGHVGRALQALPALMAAAGPGPGPGGGPGREGGGVEPGEAAERLAEVGRAAGERLRAARLRRLPPPPHAPPPATSDDDRLQTLCAAVASLAAGLAAAHAAVAGAGDAQPAWEAPASCLGDELALAARECLDAPGVGLAQVVRGDGGGGGGGEGRREGGGGTLLHAACPRTRTPTLCTRTRFWPPRVHYTLLVAKAIPQPYGFTPAGLVPPSRTSSLPASWRCLPCPHPLCPCSIPPDSSLPWPSSLLPSPDPYPHPIPVPPARQPAGVAVCP